MPESPEVALKKFTAMYRKTVSIALIPKPDLEGWRKWTKRTDGKLIPIYMSPDLWSESVGALQTASAIVGAYTPASLTSSKYFTGTLRRLYRRILIEVKRSYDGGPSGTRKEPGKARSKSKRGSNAARF